MSEDITIVAYKGNEKIEIETTKSLMGELLSHLVFEGYRRFSVR